VLNDADEALMYALALERVGFIATWRDSRTFTMEEYAAADVMVVNDGGAEIGPMWEVLEQVCGLDSTRPVIVLSAYVRADRETRERAAGLGCAAFVAKPCTPDRLLAIVRRVLAGERGLEEM
jgi:two-component system, cell cycle response regulator DivK